MKLREWLVQEPEADYSIPTAFDDIVEEITRRSGITEEFETRREFLWYTTGRVHLLHMLLEHGMPEDLQQVYHRESL